MTGVLIIDDRPIVLDTLRRLLAPTGITVHTTTSPAEGERLAREFALTLVVTDLAFPGTPLGGLALIRRLRSRPPAPRVLVFSMYDEAPVARQALQAGALGYVCKTAGLEEFAQAYRYVLSGKGYLNPDLAFALAVPPPPPADPLDRLTGRQLRILQLLAGGQTYRRIADLLLLSVKTIANEVATIGRQVQVPDKAGMVRFAIRYRDAIVARQAADLP
ncbi:response regulator transcription factor [Methylobacterium nodulans]|uniref:Two component transcriptional regulator, LuxR family n=1 Tax=Methylobacterium nodulans (strain LMG 21967 / CNCM I-2342 / ORS 2060) TaxID=460265 RepID=B8IWX7_METNO|nr:response regulator transcription factor [Methylobacterium nodulans]ACL63018.1 two component transcriptional regulator, LuxR family [Methylobacterium nodulans ORS 2060]